MPSRKTTRGAERTQLDGDYDVLICGASFAGLTVARELAGTRVGDRPARVLLLDRYEIGERQTSACAAPTEWLTALGLERSIRQTFSDLVIHTPYDTARYGLPWTFSTFDYRTLCSLLEAQIGRRVRDRHGDRSRARRTRRRSDRCRSDRSRRASAHHWSSTRSGGAGCSTRTATSPRRAAVARPRSASLRAAARTSRSGSSGRSCPPATAGAFPRATRSGSASARSIPAFTSSSPRSS